MRILLESPSCNAFGGSNAAVGYGWLRELARRHEITLVTYGPIYDEGHPGGVAPEIDNVTVERVPASAWRRLGRLPAYVAGARARRRQIFRSARPDLVHCVEPGGWRGPRVFATRSVPTVIGPLNGGAVPSSRSFAIEVLNALPQSPVRELVGGGARAFAVRMVNEALFGEIRTAATLAHAAMQRARAILVATDLSPGAVPPECAGRVRRVPLLGLDLQTFRPLPARARGDHEPGGDRGRRAPLRVLYAGRVVAWKGLHLLIEALARTTAAHLRIAGPTEQEWYEAHCRARAESLGVADRVTWLGPIPRHDLVPEYANADVYCMPSLWEPYGMTYAEAMACGTPVIGFAAGGVPAIVSDGTGWLVEQTGLDQAIAEIGERLRTLEEYPEQARAAGERARAHAEVTWSWPVLGDLVDGIYREVAR